MTRKPYTTGKIFIGRLPKDADLVESITRIANEEGIKVGAVEVFGSVSRVALAHFNQQTKFPESREHDGGYDIASVSGTISQFKGRALAKLAGTFAGPDGTLVGGPIALGTISYACEVVLTELSGGTLSRDFDMETGLPVWKGAALVEMDV